MSQENFIGVARQVLLEKNPDLFTIDLAKHREQVKQLAIARDAQPRRSDGPAEELQRLRRELFNLTERAKNTEIYRNNQAGNVRGLEERIAHTIKQKKVAVANGNERAERNSEQAIEQLEVELADGEKEFQRARRVSVGAAHDLKEWPHRERVEELQKLVG